MNKKVSLSQFGNELEKILAEYQQEAFEVRQKAVQAGAEVFKAAMEAAEADKRRNTIGGTLPPFNFEIGRASCRERVYDSV